MAYDLTLMQDITISEKPLLQQYNALFTNQQIATIPTFLANNPNLQYKIFNAYNFNRVAKNLNDYGFSTQWDSTVAYVVDDLVYIQGQPGGRYKCLVANTNQNPTTATTYWQLQTSINGTTTNSLTGNWLYNYNILYNYTNWGSFEYKGIWQYGTTYYRNNLVKTYAYYGTDYGTVIQYAVAFVCVAEEAASVLSPPDWVRADNAQQSVGWQTSDTVPTNLVAGDIYIQTNV